MKTSEEVAEAMVRQYITAPFAADEMTPRQLIAGLGISNLVAASIFDMIADAIDADRAQRSPSVVAIRNGEVFEGHGVEVMDLDFLSLGAVTRHSDFDQTDIDQMIEKLTRAGLPSAADDVREWWAER